MTTHPAAFGRRAVLASAIVVPLGLAAGCGSDSGSGPSADETVTAAVVAAEQQLLAQYDAVLAKFPNLADTLNPIRSQHAEHLTSLAASPGSPGESPAMTATSSAAALRELATAERSASRQRIDSCGRCESGDLAWLLSLIGASEAQHAAQLAGTST